tara:strand:- start:178 stop:294 length:117 start_codon:yes stop_codon:yes gene_type:complete
MINFSWQFKNAGIVVFKTILMPSWAKNLRDEEIENLVK